MIAGLVPGEPLPAERDLARDLGVARMTLRRAVDGLVEEKRLIRRRGSGTFVAGAKVNQRLAATSFSADMRARGLRPGSHTVESRRFPAGMMLAALLTCRRSPRCCSCAGSGSPTTSRWPSRTCTSRSRSRPG